MGALEDDHLIKMVQRMAAAFAALGARLLGLKGRRRFDACREEIRATGLALLGVDPGLLDAMDAPSAAAALRDWQRVLVLARLTEERAEIDRLEGLEARAAAGRRRALALASAAAQAGGAADPECARTLERLRAAAGAGG